MVTVNCRQHSIWAKPMIGDVSAEYGTVQGNGESAGPSLLRRSHLLSQINIEAGVITILHQFHGSDHESH